MNFNQAISRFKRTWFIGKALNILLFLAAILAAAALLYGLADSVWALSTSTRNLINTSLIAAVSLAAIIGLARALRTSRSSIASLADSALDNRSKTIRAAADLHQQESISPLQDYLSQQAQEKAISQIQSVPVKRKIPVKSIRNCLLAIAAVIGIAIGIRAANPSAFDTVSQRLLHPSSDVPPYSPLKFEITKDSESSVYGGENHVYVTITGAELEHDVVCLIKNTNTGKVETISTFQEQNNRFSKKFSNITSNIQFAFASGNARSEWQNIECLLQPKFTDISIKITPPSYTKRKPVEFPLEGNRVKTITGSTVALTITSNRPLSGGELKAIAFENSAAATTEPLRVTATQTDKPNQVTFTWTAHHTTDIHCTIRDIRHTPSANDLNFTLLTISDQAPIAEISSPSRFVLATPTSRVPVKGYVDDDYQVDSVQLVRTLVGFRDRSKEIATDIHSNDYEFRKTLDLGKLGVAPGQTLELYLQANDYNPSLLGIGTSDILRIGIISEQEYAKRLRDKIDMRNFDIRFRKITAAIHAAAKSLRTLNDANMKQQADSFKTAKAASINVHKECHKLALAISQDFEAFELERKLTEVAAELADILALNLDDLDELTVADPVELNRDQITRMLDRLGQPLKKAQAIQGKAQDIQKWLRVATLAGNYLTLYHNQRSITSRITKIAKEIHNGIKRNAPQIKTLGATQQKNKKQLSQFAKALLLAARGLPDKHEDLAKDCGIFLKKLEELNISDPMDAATTSCSIGKSVDAANHAHFALSLMQQLLDMENNKFADLINGRLPKKKNQDAAIHKTMQQMLDAQLRKNRPKGEKKQGPGDRPGRRLGAGAGPGQGQGQGGRLGRNAPMFGPARLRFGAERKGGGKGKGQDSGNGSNRKTKISGQGEIASSAKRDSKSSQSTRANIPNKYKSAVKRFYSEK